MVLGCGIILAAEEATFGLPEPRVGRLPLDGGIVLLPRQVPYHIAMGMLLTGRRLRAAEGLAMGHSMRSCRAPGSAMLIDNLSGLGMRDDPDQPTAPIASALRGRRRASIAGLPKRSLAPYASVQLYYQYRNKVIRNDPVQSREIDARMHPLLSP
jgi:enoyl-CoA hydratase/carnithine racemase